jgi:hypothetical protein
LSGKRNKLQSECSPVEGGQHYATITHLHQVLRTPKIGVGLNLIHSEKPPVLGIIP